jgi:hypothetical protein
VWERGGGEKPFFLLFLSFSLFSYPFRPHQ